MSQRGVRRDRLVSTLVRPGLLATLAGLSAAFLALPPVPSWGAPPEGVVLKKMLEIKEKGITIRYPEGWSIAPKRFSNMDEIINLPADRQAAGPATARIKITTEARMDHAEAVRRLGEIGAGGGASATAYQVIGGWPGLQWSRVEERPQPSQGPPFADPMILRVTTAAAVDRSLVRVEASLPSDASHASVAVAEAMGKSLVFAAKGDPVRVHDELNSLRRGPRNDPSPDPATIPQAALTLPSGGTSTASTDGEGAWGGPPPGFTQRLITNRGGELEIAVSPNGRNIVVGQQSAFRTSNDGGQTFPFSGFVPFGSGDPSLAFGQSGNFYYAGIRGCPTDSTCTGIARSTNSGQTFPVIANAVVCPNSGPSSCFPDQEHIAADRFNAAAGGDQVYSTWRNFDSTDQDPAIVCSQNSGLNWTAPLNVGSGFFPRINVGQDGTVYVVYFDGGNYMVQKYSSCASGLVAQPGFPVAITPRVPVACPFAGHDRCDQNPSSQMIAVDDTNPNHVYFAYAQNTGAGNEDIFVRDSLNGGLTWPAPRVVKVNSLITGKRIMPWVCTTGGEAFATWYDRRNAPPTNNDLTDYFAGRAHLDGLGTLLPGADFRLTDVADPWCASGWPCGTRSTTDSESCSVQPQLAGICCTPMADGSCPGSQQRCDFSDGGCPAGESCNTAGGCPKYGDYNGNACIAGRLYSAWASATSPSSISPPSNSIDIFFSVRIVGSVSQIQVPGGATLPDTCVGASSTATLNVCNTGTANLEVAPITSSNTQFAVTNPSGGYPVFISPDFCFPFQVRFTPTSSGVKTGNLTIPTNDPTSPTVTVAVSGSAGQPRAVTLMANAGSFGDVCLGSFKDLDLTISNSGACDLSVSSIISSSPEFLSAGVVSYPLVIAPGGSLSIPIRFQPTSLGPKGATLTIGTNDPLSPAKIVTVSGNAPSGDIRVTGSGDFGDVCPGALADRRISVCNVGSCNLTVANAHFDPPCPDFRLINRWFPAVVSHDFCLDLVVRFTPTSSGPKSCNLLINTDDPDTPVSTVVVTANSPAPAIDVPPDLAFPPTVLRSVGACSSSAPFPISNTGACNLTISSVAITNNAAEYSLSGLPSSPIVLEPGHIVGSGDMSAVFSPMALDRDLLGTLSVTYVSDAITGTTTTVNRALCGEGVRTGTRVLVRQMVGGVPVPLSQVEAIQIQRITGNRNGGSLLDTVDVAHNLPLQSVTPAPPCGPIQYHREYGTVSNPIQLLPGSYQITATAIVNGKRMKKNVGLDLNTCSFNPTVIITFQESP